jgi:tripartite-type tricarboxylate transporter receptor subunit TctC
LAVPPDSPYKTTADLIAAAKKAPDSVAYASGGNGSPQHIGFAMFNSQTNTVMKHIPYKGASQAAQDVASGQVPVTMQGIATVAGLVKGGKLRIMGVSMKQRHPQFPDVPTISESGAPGFEFSTWFLVTAPPGTPKDIVTRLNREIVKALADPELRERYETLGLAPLGTSPEELATRTQQQFAKYAKVIKDNQIRSD